MNNWSWSYVGEIMPDILKGLWITIQATFYGSLVAFALGLVWALLLRSPSLPTLEQARAGGTPW